RAGGAMVVERRSRTGAGSRRGTVGRDGWPRAAQRWAGGGLVGGLAAGRVAAGRAAGCGDSAGGAGGGWAASGGWTGPAP
ncbi:hypothetical protein DIJ62_26980, partial [Burkholderia pseudomallei]